MAGNANHPTPTMTPVNTRNIRASFHPASKSGPLYQTPGLVGSGSDSSSTRDAASRCASFSASCPCRGDGTEGSFRSKGPKRLVLSLASTLRSGVCFRTGTSSLRRLGGGLVDAALDDVPGKYFNVVCSDMPTSACPDRFRPGERSTRGSTPTPSSRSVPSGEDDARMAKTFSFR